MVEEPVEAEAPAEEEIPAEVEEPAEEDEVISDEDEDEEDEVIPDEEEDEEDEVIPDEDEDEEDEVIPDEEEDEEDEIIPDEDEDEEDEIIPDEEDDGHDRFVQSLFTVPETKTEDVIQEEPAEEEDAEDEISDSIQASDTVMNIFGAVAEVKSIKQQLTETFTKFEFQDSVDLLAPYDINFVVTGNDMSVKSQIAIGIAKALNTYHICDKNKLVRAKASDLNSRDFTSIFPRLKSGCLIIESAGELNESAAQIIADYIQQENQDVAIVLEGEEKQIMEMFSRFPVLRQKFLNIIHIGKYNENELVQLASGYARKKGYEVSRTAAVALKEIFRKRMKNGDSVNYEDIISIVEEGITSLEKRNMENLFMTVLDNKYEEAAMFLLQPADFAEPGKTS